MPEEIEAQGLGGESSSAVVDAGPLETADPEKTGQPASSETAPGAGGAAAEVEAESVESLPAWARTRLENAERVASASGDVITARTEAFDRVMSENQRIQSQLANSIKDDEEYFASIESNDEAWQTIVSNAKLYRQWQQRSISLDQKRESLASLQERELQFSKEAFGILNTFREKVGMDEKQWDEFLATNGQIKDPMTGRITRNAFANLSPHQALRVGMDQLRGRYLKPLMAQATKQARIEAEGRHSRTVARALPVGGGGTPLPQSKQTDEEKILLDDLQAQLDRGDL